VSSNLPSEIRAQLAHLPDVDIKRLENLLDRGITAPLNNEREGGAFLLYLMGDSLEEIATKTGTPKDVILLTFIKYQWSAKKDIVLAAGMEKVVENINKDLANSLLIATHKVVKDQIAQVLSGKIAPEKCTYIPKSLNGLQQLIEMTSKVNNLIQDGEKKQGNTIVQAQSVQINQSIGSEIAETKRISREERLARLAKEKD